MFFLISFFISLAVTAHIRASPSIQGIPKESLLHIGSYLGLTQGNLAQSCASISGVFRKRSFLAFSTDLSTMTDVPPHRDLLKMRRGNNSLNIRILLRMMKRFPDSTSIYSALLQLFQRSPTNVLNDFIKDPDFAFRGNIISSDPIIIRVANASLKSGNFGLLRDFINLMDANIKHKFLYGTSPAEMARYVAYLKRNDPEYYNELLEGCVKTNSESKFILGTLMAAVGHKEDVVPTLFKLFDLVNSAGALYHVYRLPSDVDPQESLLSYEAIIPRLCERQYFAMMSEADYLLMARVRFASDDHIPELVQEISMRLVNIYQCFKYLELAALRPNFTLLRAILSLDPATFAKNATLPFQQYLRENRAVTDVILEIAPARLWNTDLRSYPDSKAVFKAMFLEETNPKSFFAKFDGLMKQSKNPSLLVDLIKLILEFKIDSPEFLSWISELDMPLRYWDSILSRSISYCPITVNQFLKSTNDDRISSVLFSTRHQIRYKFETDSFLAALRNTETFEQLSDQSELTELIGFEEEVEVFAGITTELQMERLVELSDYQRSLKDFAKRLESNSTALNGDSLRDFYLMHEAVFGFLVKNYLEEFEEIFSKIPRLIALAKEMNGI